MYNDHVVRYTTKCNTWLSSTYTSIHFKNVSGSHVIKRNFLADQYAIIENHNFHFNYVCLCARAIVYFNTNEVVL